MMNMIVLRACLHRIGHYGGLDIASPQIDNIGEQALPSPHFRKSLQRALRRYPASKYRFGSRRRPRLCLDFSRGADLSLICELVRSHHPNQPLEKTCQPGKFEWDRVAAIVNRLKVSE